MLPLGKGRHVPPAVPRTGAVESRLTVLILFQRALELQIPHNHFAVWMVTLRGRFPG